MMKQIRIATAVLMAGTTLATLAQAQDAPVPALAASGDGASPSADLTLPAAPDAAGVVDPFYDRGSLLPQSLIYFQSQGAHLVSLGEVGGLSAYLVESANGGHQVIYALPDGDHIVAGTMFDSTGANVTSRQIGRMVQRFADAAQSTGAGEVTRPDVGPETDPKIPFVDRYAGPRYVVTPMGAREGGVDAFLVQAAEPDADGRRVSQIFYVAPDARFAVAGIAVRKDGTIVTGLQLAAFRQKQALVRETQDRPGSEVAATSPNKPAPREAAFKAPVATVESAAPSPAVLDPDPVQAASPAVVPSQAPAVADVPATQATPQAISPIAAPVAPAASAPAAAGSEHAAKFRSTGIDVAQLTDALKRTAFFSVGEREAPALYMVADPQCPFCHEAWKRLAPKVANRDVQMRIIMIAGLRGSEEMARSIISREDPGKAWLAGEGSVNGVRVKEGPLPGSDEWKEAGRWIEMNGNFAKRFDIRQTPFLVYVGKDHEVYFSLGLPADMNEFLSAI